MKFNSAFTLLACAFVAEAATVANVIADIARINTAVIGLNNKVIAFTGNRGAALEINTSFGSTVANVNAATTDTNDLNPVPIALADATNIVNAVAALAPVIINLLNDIEAKQADFDATAILGVQTLIESDLTNFNIATTALVNAVIAQVPPSSSLLASATSLKNELNAAFVTATATFS